MTGVLITRCVCRNFPFARLLALVRTRRWDLEDVITQTGCGDECAADRPCPDGYVCEAGECVLAYTPGIFQMLNLKRALFLFKLRFPIFSEAIAKGAKCTRFNGPAQTHHQLMVVVQIVFRHQHRAKDFPAPFQVMQVGA